MLRLGYGCVLAESRVCIGCVMAVYRLCIVRPEAWPIVGGGRAKRRPRLGIPRGPSRREAAGQAEAIESLGQPMAVTHVENFCSQRVLLRFPGFTTPCREGGGKHLKKGPVV